MKKILGKRKFFGHETDFSVIFTSLLLIPHIHGPIIYVAWTLYHTIIFYIYFSLLFLFNKNVRKIMIIFWLLLNIIFFVSQYINLNIIHNTYTDYLFSHYNLEFALGAVVAWLVRKRPIISPKLIMAVGLIALLLAVIIRMAIMLKIASYLPIGVILTLAAFITLIGGSLLYSFVEKPLILVLKRI